jgi:microcystin-dependent protein
VFTATDADDANELASMWEAKGDLVSHGVSTFARLAVGSDDYVLTASSGASSGLAWGLVDTDNIAADAVTTAKIAAGAVDTAELASGAVTEAKLVAALVEKLVPAGTVAATVRSTADSGWLLLDGATITSADSTYPALWAIAPASWKSGTSLVLPTMANKMLEGAGTTTLGASDGSNTASLSATNLPKHTHTIDHGHGHNIEADQEQHRHTVDPPSTTVGITDPGHQHGLGLLNDGGIPGFPGEGHGGSVIGSWDSYGATTGISASVNIAQFNSGYADPAIEISGEVTDLTGGNSGNGGAALTGAAFNVTNAHLAVNFQIKAH